MMGTQSHQRATAKRLQLQGRSLLSDLWRPRPARALRDTASCYGLILLAFALLAIIDSGWALALGFVLIGNRQYALSILAHDGKHGNLLPNRSVNNLFTFLALCAPIGVDFRGEKLNHLAHHRLLGSESDPDRHLHIVSNKATRGRFLLFVSGLPIFPRSVTDAVRSSAHVNRRRWALTNFVIDRGPTLAAQGIIFMGIVLVFPWWYYPVLWVAPIYVFLFVPHKVRMFCEHAAVVLPDSAGDSRRLVTFVPNRLERVLLAPMNANFHAEHHLWPSVPYSNVPLLHNVVAADRDVHVRRSYLRFLWQYFQQLPLRSPG